MGIKASRASSTPQSEQISVLLSRREIAPGYSPAKALLGIYPRQRGQRKSSNKFENLHNLKEIQKSPK